MIAELGLAALWLAAGFAAVQAAAGIVPRLADLAAPAAWAHALLLALALAALLAVFAWVDLSVEAVAAAADIGLPLPYRLAACWSAPAGAMLLGSALLAGMAGAVAFFGGQTPQLARLGGVALIADVALLVVAPFARAEPWPTAGNGLPALLQQPLLPVVAPLLAASGAAVVAGLTALPARATAARWLWAATAIAATALLVSSRGHWLARAEPGGSPSAAAAVFVTLAAALLVDHAARRWRPGSIAALAGAVLAAGAAAGGATESTRILALARLAPAAGPGWTAIVARLRVGGVPLAPEWRTYAPRGEAFARAAAAPGWRGTVAATLRDPPRAGPTRVTVVVAPLLPWFWLGTAGLALGAVLAAARR